MFLFEVMELEVMMKNAMMEILTVVMAVVHPELSKILMHVIEHQTQILTFDKYALT